MLQTIQQIRVVVEEDVINHPFFAGRCPALIQLDQKPHLLPYTNFSNCINKITVLVVVDKHLAQLMELAHDYLDTLDIVVSYINFCKILSVGLGGENVDPECELVDFDFE